MAKIKVFIDSDVIISSLISQTGASNIILNNPHLKTLISNFSSEELERITNKLKIDKSKLEKLLKRKLEIIKLKLDRKEIIDKYSAYTNDISDAHIVAGAKISKAKFLVTFNVKDYKVQEILQELDIRVLRPGELLQYLRSVE